MPATLTSCLPNCISSCYMKPGIMVSVLVSLALGKVVWCVNSYSKPVCLWEDDHHRRIAAHMLANFQKLLKKKCSPEHLVFVGEVLTSRNKS